MKRKDRSGNGKQFSLSRMIANLNWLSRNDVAYEAETIEKVRVLSVATSRELIDKVSTLATAVRPVSQLRTELDAHKRRLIDVHADLIQATTDIRRLENPTHLQEPYRTRIISVEDAFTRVTKSLEDRQRRIDARLEEVERKARAAEELARGHDAQIRRVVQDADVAGRVAVREAFEALKEQPTITSAAFANVENFTEVVASKIDRG